MQNKMVLKNISIIMMVQLCIFIKIKKLILKPPYSSATTVRELKSGKFKVFPQYGLGDTQYIQLIERYREKI